MVEKRTKNQLIISLAKPAPYGMGYIVSIQLVISKLISNARTGRQKNRKITDWYTSGYFRLLFSCKDQVRGKLIIMPNKTGFFENFPDFSEVQITT